LATPPICAIKFKAETEEEEQMIEELECMRLLEIGRVYGWDHYL